MKKYYSSKISLITTLFISLFIFGCSSTSNLNKQTDKANQAVVLGDFETAFNLYDAFIKDQQSKNKEVSGEVFSSAAKAALQLYKFIDAEAYFKQSMYKGYGDADLYYKMSDVYKKMGNLSKELDALEFFLQHFAQDARHNEVKKRVFELYIESENWEKAVDLWPTFDVDSQSDIHLMELNFIAQKKLDNKELAEQMAASLLKKSVTNRLALEWMAEKYFWKAENTYQGALAAYEKNKTTKQYNIMLKALDNVTADFKKSMKYYKMLYKIHPTKEYAKYISNIYTRFSDKKNSDYYLKLSK